MPWTNLVQPALGLATLRGHLERATIPCRVYHANLDLLEYVSVETYNLISDMIGLNEFVFTALLQPELDEPQLQAVARQCTLFANRKCNANYPDAQALARLFLALREHVIPHYLAGCADRILALEPSVVGFTCMFDQTLASVALAKLLREAAPDLTLALGGYAVQHDNGIEVLKSFPWIDCIARGDGEPVIEQLAWSSVGVGDVNEVKGLLTRETLPRRSHAPAPRWNLRESAVPNFDDWFADLQRLDTEHNILIESPFLLIESSRGCWWGQKHHCTFCGIDEDTLKYRSKSADQVLHEITSLRARYGDRISLRFADYILPHGFYRDLLPQLAALDPPVQLEAEIKANQKPETVRAFAQAGFVGLQPGIESFSSSTLRKMDKGVSGTQNVELLKWGYLNGIEIQYNILVGFPDDDPADYLQLAERLPRLYHLTPPTNFSLVAVTRFAPLQATPDRFGFTGELRHHSFYDVLFSQAFLDVTGFSLDNYCYNFERYFENDDLLQERYAQLRMQTEVWREQHHSRDVYLAYTRAGRSYLFEDARFGEAEEFCLDGVAADIYALCDESAISVAAVKQQFEVAGHTLEQIDAAIAQLDDLRVVWSADGELFGLGMPKDVVSKLITRNFKRRWNALAHG